MFGLNSDYETDAYENHERDQWDTDFGHTQSYSPRIVTCKHCKKSGFFQAMVEGKWEMKDTKGVVHQCLTDNARKPLSEKQAVTKAKLETVLGTAPSINDINYIMQLAALEDKRDRHFQS